MEQFVINSASLSALLAGFISFMRTQGYKTGTVQSVRSCLTEFLSSMESFFGISDVRRIEPVHITRYYRYLESRPGYRRSGALSSCMLRGHIYALRMFFGWLVRMEILDANPFSMVELQADHVPFRLAISEEDIQTLFEVARTERERALLCLGYSGLRRSEISRLNCRDIEWGAAFLTVKRGKFGKRREVPLPPKVVGHLKTYHRGERQKLWKRGKMRETEAFLLNGNGRRLSGGKAYDLFKEVLARTALPWDVNLHTLRHSFASHLSARGCPVEIIQELLGHDDLDTTIHYLRYQELHAVQSQTSKTSSL